jgi:hypothetical protein
MDQYMDHYIDIAILQRIRNLPAGSLIARAPVIIGGMLIEQGRAGVPVSRHLLTLRRLIFLEDIL